jgi:hypothetical protein
MVRYGFTLMSELHGPTELVTQALEAENAGFDFRRWTDAGFTHVALVHVADDQEGFMRAWSDDIRPRLP